MAVFSTLFIIIQQYIFFIKCQRITLWSTTLINNTSKWMLYGFNSKYPGNGSIVHDPKCPSGSSCFEYIHKQGMERYDSTFGYKDIRISYTIRSEGLENIMVDTQRIEEGCDVLYIVGQISSGWLGWNLVNNQSDRANEAALSFDLPLNGAQNNSIVGIRFDGQYVGADGNNDTCWINYVFMTGIPIFTDDPTANPTNYPTNLPSITPSNIPSHFPSLLPTHSPSKYPSALPSYSPSKQPSNFILIFNSTNNATNVSTISQSKPNIDNKSGVNIIAIQPTMYPSQTPSKTHEVDIFSTVHLNSVDQDSDDMDAIKIAAIACGCMIVIILLCFGLFKVYKKFKQKINDLEAPQRQIAEWNQQKVVRNVVNHQKVVDDMDVGHTIEGNGNIGDGHIGELHKTVEGNKLFVTTLTKRLAKRTVEGDDIHARNVANVEEGAQNTKETRTNLEEDVRDTKATDKQTRGCAHDV